MKKTDLLVIGGSAGGILSATMARNSPTTPGASTWLPVTPGETYTMSATYTAIGDGGASVWMRAFTAAEGSDSTNHSPNGFLGHPVNGRYTQTATFTVPAGHTRMTASLSAASGSPRNTGKFSLTVHNLSLQSAEASGTVSWRSAWI